MGNVHLKATLLQHSTEQPVELLLSEEGIRSLHGWELGTRNLIIIHARSMLRIVSMAKVIPSI